ncbi:hypothetical protein IFM89_036436 [Coptis chinensis]|uniref:Glutamyl-tRNA(Gln) amidotransferase subunit C, chloroplastic/mitochondrial n=1 Tax=Coptis chinensis TaxID=261450 RepID=A0A835IGF1_9MAGN|nr:hypothetical protein IFM89_036436 [Coptis chinensis]
MMASGVVFIVRGVPLLRKQLNQRSPFVVNGPLSSSKSTSRNFSAHSSLPPPNVARLAQTARISLTDKEVEEFAPKIQQVIDCYNGFLSSHERFGQLQAVDLESIEPALRADAEGDNLRQDTPETFENREAILAAVPNYDDPYIKVPQVVNKE